MPVRDPMSRLISFRLSEGEYQALQRLCDAQEARSLSDFVRVFVRQIACSAPRLPQESPENDWTSRLARDVVHLSRKTDALDREIRRLKLLLEKP